MGLPPLLVILRRPYRAQVCQSSTLSSSGGKPTFPTCHRFKSTSPPKSVFTQSLKLGVNEKPLWNSLLQFTSTAD